MSAVESTSGPRVLLVVHTHSNSYVHLPAHLVAAGFRLDLIARAGNPLLHSRSIDQRWSVSGPPSRFIETVVEQLHARHYDALQMLDEPALLALLGGAPDPRLKPFLPFTHPTLLAGVGKKDRFHAWCDEAGLPTPVTLHVNQWEDVESATKRTGYPVFLKGSTGSGGQTVRRLEHAGQLGAAAVDLAAAGPWLVQQEITGSTCGVQIAAHRGRLLGWFALHKRVMLLRGRGPTVIGEFCAPEGLEDICRRACASGGFSGLHGFDFMLGADGRPLLIDPHIGRCTTMNHFGPQCGVDLAVAWRDALLGREAPVARPTSVGGVFTKFPEIIQLYLTEGLAPSARQVRPWRKRTRIGYGRRQEWRAIGLVILDLLVSNARIKAGRLRQLLLGRRPSRSSSGASH